MNKDNAKDFLPLVQALADGKTIQLKYGEKQEWTDWPEPKFDRERSAYRIKPEPREFFIYRDDTDGVLYAKQGPPELNWKEVIRVREIID